MHIKTLVSYLRRVDKGENMKAIKIYTDGSFNKEKQLGAWAFGTKDKIIDCGIIAELD